jgi:DNA polymerase delta subunit 3
VVAQKEEEEEGTDEDVNMTDDPEPAPRPQRKKKIKKVVPVGGNGLKKKRIVKSRMTKDDKGYTSMSFHILALFEC